MKAAVKALVPALALVAALSLPAVAEAGHRHGPRCGHRGYYSDGYRSFGYSHGNRHGYYSRPYAYTSRIGLTAAATTAMATRPRPTRTGMATGMTTVTLTTPRRRPTAARGRAWA